METEVIITVSVKMSAVLQMYPSEKLTRERVIEELEIVGFNNLIDTIEIRSVEVGEKQIIVEV